MCDDQTSVSCNYVLACCAPQERPPVVALENVEDLLSEKDDNFKWPPEFATLNSIELLWEDARDDPYTRATHDPLLTMDDLKLLLGGFYSLHRLMGYEVAEGVFASKEYSSPQRRRRAYVLALSASRERRGVATKAMRLALGCKCSAPDLRNFVLDDGNEYLEREFQRQKNRKDCFRFWDREGHQ
eukprot:6473191-Amphidinium_carterae.3